MSLLKNRGNVLILSISILLPILSFFVDHYSFNGSTNYGYGIPFNYIFYASGLGPPTSRFDVFSDISHFLLRIDLYALCVLVYFIVTKLGVVVV